MLLLGMLPKASFSHHLYLCICVFVHLCICVSAMEFPTCFLMLPPHLESLVIICLSSHFLCSGKNQFLLSGRNFIRISFLAALFIWSCTPPDRYPRILFSGSTSLSVLESDGLQWSASTLASLTPRGGVSWWGLTEGWVAGRGVLGRVWGRRAGIRGG